MTDYQQLIENMPQQTYQNLKQSLELGKWPDGKALSREQRENAMQAVIAWGRYHLKESDQVGFINKKNKEGEVCAEPEQTTLTWVESNNE